jgi:hypothetical protein
MYQVSRQCTRLSDYHFVELGKASVQKADCQMADMADIIKEKKLQINGGRVINGLCAFLVLPYCNS